MKELTKDKEFVLASSSQTRIKLMNKYAKNFIAVNHSVNEAKFKKLNLPPEKCAQTIACAKAQSVQHIYPKLKIIGCDQILICRNKLFSKPNTEKEAIQNLMELQNNVHTLFTSLVIIQNQEIYYEITKVAKLFFKSTSESEIEKYVRQNKSIVFSSVGSYKIEENDKFKLVEVLSGDKETIVGFPFNEFLKSNNK